MRTVRRPGKFLQVASLSAQHWVEFEATTDEQRNDKQTGEHTGGDVCSDTHGLRINRKQRSVTTAMIARTRNDNADFDMATLS